MSALIAYPALPASPKEDPALELMMLNKLYDAMDEHLETYQSDYAEMGHLTSAADAYQDWWDNGRPNDDEDARDEAITDFFDAIRGILPADAVRYYQNHPDWEGVLGNLAAAINDFDPEEE